MGRLTWQNVDAPDFRAAMEGLRGAGDTLVKGLGFAKAGLADFENDKRDNLTNQVMADMLKYQDPAAVQAALASGEMQGKYNPMFLNKDAIAAMANRSGELMKQQTDMMKLGQDKVQDADFQFINAPENRAIVNAYTQLRRTNDIAGAQKLLDANPAFRDKVNPDTLNRMVNAGQDGFRDDLSNTENQWGFGNKQEDRQVGLAADELFQEGYVQNEGEAYFNQNQDALIAKIDAKYGPGVGQRAFMQAVQRVRGGGSPAGSIMGGALGGAGSPTGGTGIGGRNIADVVLGDTSGGGNSYGIVPPKPVSQMSMGELYDFQRNVMLPKTRAAGVANGVGSSAAGAYQIVSQTLGGDSKNKGAAEAVFGANWRNVPFSLENQDKIAQYLFERRKVGDDLHNEWEGLPKGFVKTKDMTWDQVRNKITSKESGGNVGHVTNPVEATDAIQYSLKHRIAQDEAFPLIADFNAAWTDTATSTAIGKRLTAEGGDFAGENANYVQDVVQQIQSKYGIKSAAVAGTILARSRDGEKGFFPSLVNGVWGTTGLKSSINWDKVEQLAGFAKDRNAIARAAVSINDATRASADVDKSNALVADIVARRDAAKLDAENRGVRFNEARWNSQIEAARGKQDASLRSATVPASAMQPKQDTGPVGTNKTRQPEAPVKTAPAAAPKKAAAEARPTAKQINDALAEVRRTGKAKNSETMSTTGIQSFRNTGNYNRAVNVATELAMKSGRLEFAQLPTESYSGWKRRVQRILLKGKHP